MLNFSCVISLGNLGHEPPLTLPHHLTPTRVGGREVVCGQLEFDHVGRAREELQSLVMPQRQNRISCDTA